MQHGRKVDICQWTPRENGTIKIWEGSRECRRSHSHFYMGHKNQEHWKRIGVASTCRINNVLDVVIWHREPSNVLAVNLGFIVWVVSAVNVFLTWLLTIFQGRSCQQVDWAVHRTLCQRGSIILHWQRSICQMWCELSEYIETSKHKVSLLFVAIVSLADKQSNSCQWWWHGLPEGWWEWVDIIVVCM